jgi:hypothetical protein
MSDATERPAAQPPTADMPDADAWAHACAEDLAAERARRRERHGAQPGSAAEELRRLADAVAGKLSALRLPFAGAAAVDAVQQVISQAKSAVEPVVERNPEVFEHLAAAGSELLAAYRAAVVGQERRWTGGHGGAAAEQRPGHGAPSGDGVGGGPAEPRPGGEQRPGDDDGGSSSGSQRIDLD